LKFSPSIQRFSKNLWIEENPEFVQQEKATADVLKRD